MTLAKPANIAGTITPRAIRIHILATITHMDMGTIMHMGTITRMRTTTRTATITHTSIRKKATYCLGATPMDPNRKN